MITAPPGQVIELKFDFLELETNARCRYDYVAAFDGPAKPSSPDEEHVTDAPKLTAGRMPIGNGGSEERVRGR